MNKHSRSVCGGDTMLFQFGRNGRENGGLGEGGGRGEGGSEDIILHPIFCSTSSTWKKHSTVVYAYM